MSSILKTKSLLILSLALILPVFFLCPSITDAKVKKDSDYSKLKKSKIKAYSAVVIDKSSGKVLFSKRKNSIKPAASTTKLVSAYAYLSTKPNLNNSAKMKRGDEVGGGRLRLPVGSKMKEKYFLYASLVGSANNSATALIRLSGMSKSSFLDKMNSVAKNAGAKKTNFVDASGISSNNKTTAKDLALIARKVFKKKTIRKASGKKSKTLRVNNSRRKKIKHTSPLMRKKSSSFKVRAAKTGYLPQVGHNLVADVRGKKKSGKKKGKIIVAVIGAGGSTSAANDVSKLAKWAFNNYDWE